MAILSIACSVVLSVTLVTAVPDVRDAKQAFEKYIKDRDGSVETYPFDSGPFPYCDHILVSVTKQGIRVITCPFWIFLPPRLVHGYH